MIKKALESLIHKSKRSSQRSDAMSSPEFARAQVCIVSFPKSGRTWLRVMIGKALCDRYRLDEKLILDELAVTEAAGVLPTLYTHDGSSNTEGHHWKELAADKSPYKEKKVIFLLRDPRDVAVSCFFQATKRKGLFEGTISDFVRDDHHGIRKIVTFYNQWHAARATPKEMLVLTYEGMKEDPAGNLRRALEFIGAEGISDEVIGSAVEFAGFDNMRKMESEGKFESKKLRPKDAEDPESFKVRRGKVGGYVDYLNEADQKFCNDIIRELGCPFFPLE